MYRHNNDSKVWCGEVLFYDCENFEETLPVLLLQAAKSHAEFYCIPTPEMVKNVIKSLVI